MSSNADSKVNDTIINMVSNLNPRISSEPLFNFNNPLKRTATSSASSSDEMTPKKKLRDDLKSSDVFYIGSPREVRRLRADLLNARNTITILERRVSHMHTVRKEMEIMFDRETTDWKAQVNKHRDTIEELENQLQSIRKRETSLKEELEEMSTKYTDYKNVTELMTQKLESNILNLSTELQNQNSDECSEMKTLQRKISESEFLYKAAKDETDAHKKLIDELTKRLSEKTNLENELELKSQALDKAQLQIKELEFTRESYSEFQQQAKSQQHKLATYSDLEKENQKMKEETKNLKNEVYNKLILEEEVHDLRGRLTYFQNQEKKLTALQVSNAENEAYLEEFRSLARSVCETSNSDASLPRLLRTVVERLQQQEINLTSDKIQLDSQMANALHEAKVAREELRKNQKHISDLQNTVKNQKNLIHRLQKKLTLISRERDSYRKQLDSYERDLTICINPASSANPGSIQIQTQQERIQNLEKVVDEYRDLVQKLENDLRIAEPGLHSDVAPIKGEQLIRLQNELEKLKNENIKLRERKDQVEIQLEELLVGHDKEEGRIVHITKNPLADWVKEREIEKEKLQDEMERLKKKIRNLEDGLEASKLGNVTIDNKEVQVLKENLNSSEQQKQRLKEFFKSSMQEFRNVIYMLLGYKIDKTSNSQYKLTSMYAEKSEDSLCFHLNNDGALNLLENEFSAALEEMVELHLRHQRSIPVFLSALTMELFNNKTITNTYNIDDDSDDD